MSDTERFGTRDLTYSNWHRTASLQRYIGPDAARRCTMIDLDGLEYCSECRECVGLIEVALDIGQTFKSSVVTRKLAVQLRVPGLLVFYTAGERINSTLPDITQFRVRIIAPEYGNERTLEPPTFARWIQRLHDRCPCQFEKENPP